MPTTISGSYDIVAQDTLDATRPFSKPNSGYISPLSTLTSDLGQPLDDMATNTYCDIPSPEPACFSDSDEYILVSQRRKVKTANRQRSWALNAARDSEEQEDKEEKAIREEDPYGWYRSRQRTKGGRSSVWEDDVERAFMIAIQKIPKIGKGKLMLRGKACGRNELIGEFIHRATGKRRTKKQVSSHIQVLRKLLKDCPDFMQHVEPADPSKTPPASTLEKVGGANLEQILRSAGTLSSPTISEPIHTLPDPVIHRLDRSSTSTSGISFITDTDYSDHSSDPCLSTFGTASPATSFASYTYTPPQLIPSAFEMWVSRETDLAGPFGDCSHIYTSMCREDSLQQVPVPLMSLPAWASRFPHVAELHENHQLAPECAILHFNVLVSIMPAPPPPNSVLCTQFEITVPAGHPSSAHYDVRSWECITRVYTPGKKVWELCHTVPVADDFSGAPGNRKLTLPFASDFWSAFYANLANDQQLLGHDNAGKKRREKEEKSAIKGVTIVQELFCYRSEGLESIKERAALILFDFSKTEGQQHPKAVWREITSPVSELCSLTPAHLTPELQTVHPSFLSVDSASRWQEESEKCDISLYDDMITSLDTEALQNYGSYFHSYETLYVDDQHEQFQQQQQEHQHHTTISPVDIFHQDPAQYEQAYIPMEEERYLSVMESMDGSGF